MQLIRAELPSHVCRSSRRIESSKLPRQSQLIRAEPSSNVCRRSRRIAASRLDFQVHGLSTTTAKGLFPGLRRRSLRHRRRRGTVPAHAGESATAALRLYGAVATANPFVRDANSSCSIPTLHVCVTRATVQVRHVTQGPASDLVPYVLVKSVDASTSRSEVTACWWLPTGGTVLLCRHSCIISDFKVSRLLVRHGPAGGLERGEDQFPGSRRGMLFLGRHEDGEAGRWLWTSVCRVVTWTLDQTLLWETLAPRATTNKRALCPHAQSCQHGIWH